MSTFVFNIAKGRVNRLALNVQDNTPPGCRLVLIALNVTGDQDDAMRDVDNVAALLALGNVAEVTNSGYGRISLAAADGVAVTVDVANDRQSATFNNQTFTTVGAGDPWTDLVVAYDPTGSSADADLKPLTLSDFLETPDGGDIVAQVNAAGFFRAS